MSEVVLNLQTCSTCHARIIPGEKGATKFACPECGIVTFIRCKRCRTYGHKYTCPNCGFEGP